jgi:hypothetical protein
VHYAGKAIILDDPLLLADPRTAFTESEWTEVTADLDYRRVSDMFGGEPEESHEKPGEEFAKGHYEQHVGARGVIRVGDEEWELDGYGLRDHSWGPRFWQAPWWYRWLTINFGEEAGFVISIVTARDGSQRIGGVALEDGEYRHIDHAEIETDWTGTDLYHQEIRATARAGERSYEIEGTVLNLVPLRNRRTTPDGEPLLTRISEGLTEWRWEGRTGYGLSEYLDQIVDERPVGASV